MSHPYPRAEKAKIIALVETLKMLVERDPEQEVQGIALPVLDAVLEATRRVCPDDAVVQAARSVISPEQIESGEPVRAADALLVAKQIDVAIGSEPIAFSTMRSSVLPPLPENF
jgi:hypothetical protein